MTAAAVPTRDLGRSMPRLVGLDAIRFLSAMWVVLSHYGGPPISGVTSRLGNLGGIIDSMYGVLFDGPAAVIVFFVVSGLVIHYPNSDGRPLDARAFYTRRYIRISLPLLAALAFDRVIVAVTPGSTTYLGSITWSLYAEMIYYAAYPALLLMARRFGWNALVAVSFVAAIILAALSPNVRWLWQYGIQLTWLSGLSCWLLGCLLAQSMGSSRAAIAAPLTIWLWRVGVIAAGASIGALHFRSPLGYSWSLPIFGFLVYAWLAREIPTFALRRPLPLLETWGAWSYSLYLMHTMLQALALQVLGATAMGNLALYSLVLGSALAGAVSFYVLVEHPSQLLAQHVGRHASRRRSIPQTA